MKYRIHISRTEKRGSATGGSGGSPFSSANNVTILVYSNVFLPSVLTMVLRLDFYKVESTEQRKFLFSKLYLMSFQMELIRKKIVRAENYTY